jgi:hypothetical protein
MTRSTDASTEKGAVTAVISGNRDRAAMLAQPVRYAGYDSRLSDLWRKRLDAGVDQINTDDLDALQRFLTR